MFTTGIPELASVTRKHWYDDADECTRYVVMRHEPKAFSVWRLAEEHFIDEEGRDAVWWTFVPGKGDEPYMLYRMDGLAKLPKEYPVVLCEGERDADTATWQLKLVATTNLGGPGMWRREYSEALRGRPVVIVPHNDDQGRAHAEMVVNELSGIAMATWIVELPGLPEHGDLTDWVEAGGTREEFNRIAQARLDGPPDTPRSSGSVAVVTALDDVASEAVEWLWEDWLPRGKLVLLGGHPGDGKSTLTTMFAATISRGWTWPDGAPAPQGTSIFLLAEDSLSDTVRPRLEQHDAELSRIEALNAIRQPDGSERAFSLADHLDALEQRVVARNAALVVIDPLSAFMSNHNRNDDGEIRDLLTPLGQLAERRDVTVLCVMHVGKPGQTRRTALQSFMGSTAFGAVARQALAVYPVPGEDRRALAVIKSNVGIKPRPLEWSRPHDSAIVWHGESEHDIETLFSGGGASRPGNDAEAFLTAALAGGPRLSREVFEEAERQGLTETTVRRAGKRMGVEYRKGGGQRESPWHIGPPGTDWSTLFVEQSAAPDATPS